MPDPSILQELLGGFAHGTAESPGVTMSIAEAMRNFGLNKDYPSYSQHAYNLYPEMLGTQPVDTPFGRIGRDVGRQTLPALVMGGPMAASLGPTAGAVEAGADLLGAGAGAFANEAGADGMTALLAEMLTAMLAPSAASMAIIPAFVGTPNKWTKNPRLDRLTTNLDYINSGEGAQVRGWGNYSADLPDTADVYAKMRGTDGYMYGVMHDVMPEDLLDQDLLMGEQPWFRDIDEVVAEYKAAGKKPDAYARLIAKANANKGQTGEGFVRSLIAEFDYKPKRVAEFLREAGIPGSRFLDEGSRGPADVLVGGKPLPVAKPGSDRDPEGLASTLLREFEGDPDAAREGLKKMMRPRDFDPFNMNEELDDAIKLIDEFEKVGITKAPRSRNYVMFQDKLTYTDRARTDERLWDQLPVGQPWRTVDRDAFDARLAGSQVTDPQAHWSQRLEDPEQFKPMSHFGTKQAALDRRKDVTGFDAEIGRTGRSQGQVFEPYLDIKNPLDIGDDLANMTEGGITVNEAADEAIDMVLGHIDYADDDILNELLDVGTQVDPDAARGAIRSHIVNNYDISEHYKKSMFPHSRSFESMDNYDLRLTLLEQDVIDIDEFEEVGRSTEKLIELLRSKGYDGISYRNAVEDAGSTSYITFDRDQVIPGKPRGYDPPVPKKKTRFETNKEDLDWDFSD